MDELEGGQLESTGLETADDVADESTLDTVGLEGAVYGERPATEMQLIAMRDVDAP